MLRNRAAPAQTGTRAGVAAQAVGVSGPVARPLTLPAPASVQTLLQRARRRELRRVARGDADRVAGRRVTSLASRAVRHAELAEARDRDLTTLGQLLRDGLDDGSKVRSRLAAS